MPHILLVEDDSNLALGLKTALRTEGYKVEVVGDGEAALQRARQQQFDLILLDIKLPARRGHAEHDREGYDVCDQLRREGNTIPILMLTAKASEPERVFGFQVGADDYVIKPFSRLELLARIKAMLRRTTPESSAKPFCFGDIEVDFRKAEVRRSGLPIPMTPLEFRLLSTFIHNRGTTLTRDQLLNKLRGSASAPTDRVIDNHVMNLRKKLEHNPKEPIYFVTILGLGYRFDGLDERVNSECDS